MKIKMNRFLFGITLMLLLTVSSCKGFVQGFKSEESPKSPVITLSLDKGNARTAFPQMDTSIITKFILKGALDNGAQETLGEWSTDNATSAYDKMTADELPIAAGSWVFTLTALCEEEGVDIYSGKPSKGRVVFAIAY